jgi:hypothetical protein
MIYNDAVAVMPGMKVVDTITVTLLLKDRNAYTCQRICSLRELMLTGGKE